MTSAIFALLGIAVVVVAGLLAAGRLGEMPDVVAAKAPLDLPPGPLSAADIRAVRFGIVFRGYRMSEVDDLLDRIAAESDALATAQRSPHSVTGGIGAATERHGG